MDLPTFICQENPTQAYRYWAPVAAASGGFKMVLFTASRENIFVGGTCAPPSALLVYVRYHDNVTAKRSQLLSHNFQNSRAMAVGSCR